MAHNGNGEVSTIFLAGFPADATPRELDNLCRFMPGFVTSNVVTTKGTMLFVLFDTAANARAAISVINQQPFDRTMEGEPLRAQMARSNMRSPGAAPEPQWGPPGAAPHKVPPSWVPARHQPPPPAGPHPFEAGLGQKRPRQMPENPGQVDTVAVIGAKEKGFDEETLRYFFEGLPGFACFRVNTRVGGGFAKFASSEHAAQAVDAAALQGIPAEMAKTSMSSSAGQPAPAMVQPHSQPPPPVQPPQWGGGWGGGNKRQRTQEDPSQVDTVASIGAAEAGIDEQTLRSFFEGLPGFVAFKANPRMGGGFSKFSSVALAKGAIQAAKDSGIPADMARSSMSG